MAEPIDENAVFAAVGEDGFTRLVAAFYRQVPEDDILGPMYPADEMPEAEKRLRDFLIYRFGGPQDYIQERGHPRLRARHAPFAITPEASQRWMEVMSRAFDEASLDAGAEATLRQFFEHMTAFLVNRPA
ncbi:MAG: globin [Aureliella sp.]